MDRHLQLGDDHAVSNRFVTNRRVSVSLQREGHNVTAVAMVAYPVGANDRSAMAANSRNMAALAPSYLGKRRTGFIGHDGLPRLFDTRNGERDSEALNVAAHITGPDTAGNGNEVVVPATVTAFPEHAATRGVTLMRAQLHLESHSSIVPATTNFVAVPGELF